MHVQIPGRMHLRRAGLERLNGSVTGVSTS